MKLQKSWNAKLVLTLALASLNQACEILSSDVVDTRDFEADYQIVHEGSTVHCSASFRTDEFPQKLIELGSDDHVYCSDGSTMVEMTAGESRWPDIVYKGGNFRYKEGRSYEIILYRGNDEGLHARARAPELMKITSPQKGDRFRSKETIRVNWIRGDGHEIEAEFLYLDSSGSMLNTQRYSDSGSALFSLVPDAFESTDGLTTAKGELTLTRKCEGDMDSGLRGKIYGVSKSTVSFEWRD